MPRREQTPITCPAGLHTVYPAGPKDAANERRALREHGCRDCRRADAERAAWDAPFALPEIGGCVGGCERPIDLRTGREVAA